MSYLSDKEIDFIEMLHRKVAVLEMVLMRKGIVDLLELEILMRELEKNLEEVSLAKQVPTKKPKRQYTKSTVQTPNKSSQEKR